VVSVRLRVALPTFAILDRAILGRWARRPSVVASVRLRVALPTFAILDRAILRRPRPVVVGSPSVEITRPCAIPDRAILQ